MTQRRAEEAGDVVRARCPSCGNESDGDGLDVVEIDRSVVGEQIRTTSGVVCGACGAIVGVYSDYHRTDLVEGGSETWQRVRSVDEH